MSTRNVGRWRAKEVVSITGFGNLSEAVLVSAARLGLGGIPTCPIRGFDYIFDAVGEEPHGHLLRSVKRSFRIDAARSVLRRGHASSVDRENGPPLLCAHAPDSS